MSSVQEYSLPLNVTEVILMVNLDLRSFSFSVGLVVGHLGFCPKYRKKLFASEEIKARFFGLCRDVEERHHQKYGIRIHELGVIEDHVHMVVESGMNLSPSKLMQLFKGYTSKVLFEEFPHLRKYPYFWGGSMWSRGHYYKTTGPANYNAVRDYVRKQKEHHDRTQAKITSYLGS